MIVALGMLFLEMGVNRDTDLLVSEYMANLKTYKSEIEPSLESLSVAIEGEHSNLPLWMRKEGKLSDIRIRKYLGLAYTLNDGSLEAKQLSDE